jgi:hypothetical protein
MATQKPTTLGYGELGKLVAGEAATCVKSIVGLSGACTAAEASTFANPGGATKLAANGFALVNATTVKSSKTTVDNDTVEVNHVFTTKDAAQKTTGFAILNDDDDVVFMEACYAAEIPTEVGDTVTIVAKMTFKLGS